MKFLALYNQLKAIDLVHGVIGYDNFRLALCGCELLERFARVTKRFDMKSQRRQNHACQLQQHRLVIHNVDNRLDAFGLFCACCEAAPRYAAHLESLAFAALFCKCTGPIKINIRPLCAALQPEPVSVTNASAMSDSVPYLDLRAHLRPLRAELEAAIGRVLDNCTFCLGPEVAAFESEFAQFLGVGHCVGLNSGTSALHVAMRVLGIGAGDEVITTPFTFVATSWAISYVGARPVYVDIQDRTFNIDPELVERAITPRTKAVLAVHLYGLPCDLDALRAICTKHKLVLVEDAAQAHGAKFKGKHAGTVGEIGCFSFYPTKNLAACGEGGALVTNDSALAARARILRDHGSTKRYYHDELGYNYRMEGIQAAVLRVKLKYLPAWNAARRRVAERYSELLADTPLQLPSGTADTESAWHLYVVRHPRRDELRDYLEAHGISCATHYPLPLHLQKAYAHLGHKPGDFPVAEKAARECLCLPMYPELTDEQIQRVAMTIKEFFAATGA